jgi:hypothetical protein
MNGGKMRAYVPAFLGIIGLVVASQMAEATPVGKSVEILAPPSKSIPAASKCGKGQRWVPAGYAKHGKYRAGHCAPA